MEKVLVNFRSAIIFDMDGVIFDTENLWKEASEVINNKYQLPLDEKYRASICGKTESTIVSELENLFPNLDAKKYRQEIRDYVNNKIDSKEYHFKKGFFELINEAKKLGYKLALATSSDKKRMENLFKNKNVNPYELFDTVVTAEDINGKGKPDPLIFMTASGRLKVNSVDAFVIEDSLNGIEAAVRGGFSPIMVKDLISPNEFAKLHSVLLVDSLDEIIPILQDSISLLDKDNWDRRTQYDSFIKYTKPTFSLSVEIDVTPILNYVHKFNKSFFATFTYLLTKNLNKYQELRSRIDERNNPILFNVCHPAYVVIKEDKTILTCKTRFIDNYEAFHDQCVLDINRTKNIDVNAIFNTKGSLDSYYISCLPWIKFTSFSDPYDFSNPSQASIPRICWSKYELRDDKYYLNFNISVHHSLVDGYHICEFINNFIQSINDVNNWR